MDRGNVTLFIFTFIILLPQIIGTVAFEQYDKQSISHKVREMYSLLRAHSLSSLEKLKYVVNHVQKQYFPPNLDFRPKGDAPSKSSGGEDDSAKDKMREAVAKSFGASKSTVEESAKSAAGVVGDAMHKTAEKVKDCTRDGGCHTEL